MLTLKIVKPDDAMDWMTFVSSLVGSIAWPVAAFAIAFLFRSQIRKLLDRLRKLSVGDNSMDFSKELEEAEDTAKAIVAESAEALPSAPNALPLPDTRTQQLIALAPAMAVMDIWKPLERKIVKLAEPLALSRMKNRDGKTVPGARIGARILLDNGVITSATYSLVRDLNELRNRAAHSEDGVGRADALRFFTLAEELDRILDAIPEISN